MSQMALTKVRTVKTTQKFSQKLSIQLQTEIKSYRNIYAT